MRKLSNDRAMEMPKFVIRTIFGMFNNKVKRVLGNIKTKCKDCRESVCKGERADKIRTTLQLLYCFSYAMSKAINLTAFRKAFLAPKKLHLQ